MFIDCQIYKVFMYVRTQTFYISHDQIIGIRFGTMSNGNISGSEGTISQHIP